MLFDSMITFSAPATLRSMSVMASESLPCRVRTHSERTAPATRNRDVSVSPLRSRSSLMARKWSSPVSQSQGFPSAEQIPCPNWVIFRAVQLNSGSAAIIPAVTLVFPTFRECPPITTSAMLSILAGFARPGKRKPPVAQAMAYNKFVALWVKNAGIRNRALSYVLATLILGGLVAIFIALRPHLNQTSVAMLLVLVVVFTGVM